MLAALVLAGIMAAPLGTAALLVRSRPRVRTTGAWPATRRFAFALAGTAVLAAIVAVAMRLLGVTEHNTIAGVAGLVVASLLWLPVTRNWSPRAHLCWASSTYLFAVYLVYALEWTFASHLGAGEHGRRRAAVVPRGGRRADVLRLPVGTVRRARHRALAPQARPA